MPHNLNSILAGPFLSTVQLTDYTDEPGWAITAESERLARLERQTER